MSYSSSVPQPTFGPTGFVAPAETAIFAGVQADLATAFGSSITTGLSTPQGQIASSTTAIIGDAYTQLLFLSSMLDPAYSEGRWQDGIGRIYFITRNPAQATVVQAVCYGASGVVIPAGAVATATDGNTYAASNAGTIGTGGSVTIPFACTVTGPIACPAGSLNQITQIIPGWDSINNPSAGIIGNAVETRQAFEYRRAASVEGNATGIPGAIQGAVAAVPGVLDCLVYDNATNGSTTYNGVTIAANSVYVAVAGGTNAAVGYAIWTKKPPGCAYTGNTSVTVQDPNPAYNGAGPSYTVIFQTVTSNTIAVQVSVPNTSGVPSNAQALVTTAVNNAFAGLDGYPKISRIGATTFASRFLPGIYALGTWALGASVTVGSNAASVTSTAAQIPEPGTVTLSLV